VLDLLPMLSETYIVKQFYSEKSNEAGSFYLSLILSSHSFMYAISTQNYKIIVELCHVEIAQSSFSVEQDIERIEVLINNYGLRHQKFEKVDVAFLNTDFSLMPEAFAEDKDLKSLLKFTSGAMDIKRTFTHHLKDIEFCFTIHHDLVSYVEKVFTNASIRHCGAVTIQFLFDQHSLKSSQLFLVISDGFIELAAKDTNHLLFYNVFSYENNEDILYYLLFVMEQFDLNPLHVNLAIACQKSLTDELIKSIKKYIKHVSFCVNDSSIKLNGELAKLPQHYYFTLLSQHLCEL
jgi:hypothetical protein